MKKVLLISPHFDDAILSAGQFMADRADTEVLTIFGGVSKNIELTPYDEKCGFKSSKEAIESRRYEDREATAMLNATSVHLDFLDNQYKKYEKELDQKTEDIKISNAILKLLEAGDYEFIMAPVGLGHPDHIRVGDIVKKLENTKKIKLPCYYWEDLPLRVSDPLVVPPRIKTMGLSTLAILGQGELAMKIRALSCYRSQIETGILNQYIMYVPERFWQ